MENKIHWCLVPNENKIDFNGQKFKMNLIDKLNAVMNFLFMLLIRQIKIR